MGLITSRHWFPAIIRITLLSVIGWLGIQALVAQPDSIEREFPKTDFSNAVIPFDEIRSGGPPRDGIPALDDPKFVSAERADWLHPQEPVIVVSVGDDRRAYPIQILIWHEIVNDTVGGKPLSITFCPLCNATLVFEREFDGRVLDFGTTGRLRMSDLVMYDRQTETWWQQFTGRGLIGEYAGRNLTEYPASIVAFETFREANPAGKVLSRRTGHNRPYGDNPYRGYDRIDQSPFMFEGNTDPRLAPMERVLAVRTDDAARIYPFGEFRDRRVVNERVGERPVVVLAGDPAFSALDKRRIRESRRVATLAAYDRRVDGRELEFETRDGRIFDTTTGSEWNVLGQSVTGEMKGRELEALPGGVHFAFAWLAFRPDSTIYGQSAGAGNAD